MKVAKIIWRMVPHLLGWGALLLVVLLQNDLTEWDFEDYYILVGFFGFLGIASYINLYLLIPRYLFAKKYWRYAAYVFVLVVSTAIFMILWFSEFDHIDWFSRLIVQIISVAFFLLLTSGAKFLGEYFRKVLKIKEIENKQLKADLSLLKAQIHPHFLFNTLNNLYGLIIQNQNQKASEVTLKLADLMRYLLESSKIEQVSLQKEVKFLEDYLALEKIRLTNQADIRLEVSGFEKEVFVAPLLFIPLVENAFKHGLQTVSKNSFAYFSLSIQGNDLFFETKNSIGKNLQKVNSGTGLENLRKRLKLMYPEKHLLEVEQNQGIFKVTLQITI